MILSVEKIYENGIDPSTGDFVIPQELSSSQAKVKEQLKIIQAQRQQAENPSKRLKIEINECSAEDVQTPTTSELRVPDPLVSPEPVTSRPPITNEVKITPSSVSDFFKERSRAFKSKNPELTRASSPPPKTVPVVMPEIPPQLKSAFPVVLPSGRMAEKLRKASPYNMFLTTVAASIPTHSDPLSTTFLEILDSSLGDLESSVQLNFTVDVNWLLAQYTAAKRQHLPLIIFYGQEEPVLKDINSVRPNVKSFMIKVPGSYGCHHAKVMLLFYTDKSMRVVVSTANLYAGDWENRVQGIWISDRLAALPQNTDEAIGESKTSFRNDLVRFLTNYGNPVLSPFIERIKKSDFSSINVYLITSIPGSHSGDIYGLRRLGKLLKEHSVAVDESHAIIMQSSSVGNFGKSAAEYLTGEVATSMRQDSSDSNVKRNPQVKLIYPSLSNVKQSHDGIMGGGCLPYFRNAHSRQPWLNQYLYQWKCKSRNCDRAMPHIKSYCRYSDDGLFWFVLTSANMSKSAWGVTKKNGLNISSYEVGVAFFPRVILDGKDQFPMNEAQQKDGSPIFKLPFDIPPVPYERGDAPFCLEDMHEYQTMLMAMQDQELM